jgi:hypothetical protein
MECLFAPCARRLGQDALQVIRGNQILILRVLAQETDYVRANRDDPEMIGAREIERRACQFARQAFPFERRGHFRMDKVDAAGEPAVGEYRAKPIDLHFEAVRFFVVDDRDVVEIHIHESPRVLS